MKKDFWESSWKTVDKKRLAEYAERSEPEDWILETLKKQKARLVCDAGCGCGAYALKLLRQGFAVKGFDISSTAVEIAASLLKKAGYTAELKTATVLETGYPENEFDAVVCRDVLDHMLKKDAERAVAELYCIMKPDGVVLITLDGLDEEYRKEQHCVTEDGDYLFTSGKWEGMAFHPYTKEEAEGLLRGIGSAEVECNPDGLLVQLKK